MNQMIRHTFPPQDRFQDLTVLICQRKTPDVTKLCLESLLAWYPGIQVLVVDGDSKDESSMYLAMKQALYPNVRVHTYQGERHSHGEIMDYALRQLITSRYVLLMDSDVVTMRGGWVEGMLNYLENTVFDGVTVMTKGVDVAIEELADRVLSGLPPPPRYAIGTVMSMGIKAEGCGPAENEEDTVLYAHPSLSMINREMYLTMEPFKDHGAPCIANMVDAKEKGYLVADYPVENVSLHLSGSSWTAPRTVWWHDNDVMVRPMLSIIDSSAQYHGTDIEIIPVDYTPKRWDSIITWDMKPTSNYDIVGFNIRFNVRGEYVVEGSVDMDEIEQFRQAVIRSADDVIEINGLEFIRRKEWHRRIVT